ncbi:hypothetical protein [Campylobacter blaseri]|uniref:hypothetical protein n=1 Tax=Campylobacter blaseri TaxID=2042961 RepID=UPI001056FC38|nr:hypothetical protein [Campylobacter blaseri]
MPKNEKIVEHLKKQVLYMNFYPIYKLKTNTLIEYIKNLIEPNIKKESFISKFGFTIIEFINFLKLLGVQENNVIIFEIHSLKNNELKILELFSVNLEEVNKNYGYLGEIQDHANVFTMNPVIRHKDKFYIIGFKYFKMNFYNSLVEKIRKHMDSGINNKIGISVDSFVKNIFSRVKDNNGYKIFSGRYDLSKKIILKVIWL